MNNSNLPGGWKAVFDKAAGHTYYVDKVTQETTWTKPTAPTASYLKAKANENVAPPNFFIARKLRQYGQPIGEHSEKGIALHNEWRRKHGMPTWQEEYNAKQAAESAKENAEEAEYVKMYHQAVTRRSTKPLTNTIITTISNYFKGKSRLDEISKILGELDKRNTNKSSPTYTKYANSYLTINGALYILENRFNEYLSAGRSKEYDGIFIGSVNSKPLLEALYLAEQSIPWSTKKFSNSNDKPDLTWQGISDEELENINNRKQYLHSDFKFINVISNFMKIKYNMDTFEAKFGAGEPTEQKEIEDFNMLLPFYKENQLRTEAIQGAFPALSNDNILNELYEIEMSNDVQELLDAIKEAEETAAKEAKKSIVKPLGPEVRENQNNYFGGTRRRRRNRKSTRRNRRKSTRRNRHN